MFLAHRHLKQWHLGAAAQAKVLWLQCQFSTDFALVSSQLLIGLKSPEIREGGCKTVNTSDEKRQFFKVRKPSIAFFGKPSTVYYICRKPSIFKMSTSRKPSTPTEKTVNFILRQQKTVNTYNLGKIWAFIGNLSWPNLSTSIAACLYLAPAGGLFVFLDISLPNLT